MRREIVGKRAIVTGASSGIGRATAEALAGAGAKVALAARTAAALEELAAALRATGAEALAVSTDVSRAEDRARLVAAAVERFGGIDLLVNVAGIGSWGHFATSTPQVLRQVMEVNFFAPVELTRLAMPHLMNGDQPAVVNVTSMCGRKAMPAWSEYSASKFALVGISEAWRGEFARFGVDVITIVPGLTNSGFPQHWLRSEGRAKLNFAEGMSPTEVARAIVAAIRKNKREVVLGREARRLLWFNRFFPRLTNWLIARQVRKLYER